MRIEKSYDENELFLRLNNLRGLCALIVMFSHIWWFSGCVIKIFIPFNKIVTIAVAVFFFLSGYGMMRSFTLKKGYLRTIWKKLLLLLYKAIMAYVIASIMEYIILLGNDVNNFRYYTPLHVFCFLQTTNWYVYELAGFYLAFIVIMYIMGEKWGLAGMGIVSVIAFISLYYLGIIAGAYSSILGYVFGMFCYKYSYLRWTKHFNWIFVSAVIGLFMSFVCMFILDRTTIGFAFIRNAAAIAAIVLILHLIQYINITNFFTIFLSKISSELYFYHLFISRLLCHIIDNAYLYAVTVIVLSMVFAIIINKLDIKVTKLVKKEYIIK